MPTVPLTEATVPAIGARSSVSDTAFSAVVTLTRALTTLAFAAASAAAVGGACLTAMPTRADFTESSSDATVCASRAVPDAAVIFALFSAERSEAIFASSDRMVLASFWRPVSAAWSLLRVVLSCVTA